MASRKTAKAPSIYQIKITLKDVRPPIWRRVQVRSDEDLEEADILSVLLFATRLSQVKSVYKLVS